MMPSAPFPPNFGPFVSPALFCQKLRRGKPDPTGGTRHDDHFVFDFRIYGSITAFMNAVRAIFDLTSRSLLAILI